MYCPFSVGGALPARRRPFEIQVGGFDRIWPDGRRDVTLEVQSAFHAIASADTDFVYRGADGKIIHDSRQSRIEATRSLAELSTRCALRDPTTQKMLESFDGAVRYPEYELVYLYEIWEALLDRLHDTKTALDILKISPDNLDRLYDLTCNLPLRQGRHRGLFAGRLRDASPDERKGAWAIARDMFEKYLNYLDEPDVSKKY